MKHTAAFTAAQQPAPVTSRNLPAPWAECDVCGGPALADLDGSPRCPSCAQAARLYDAAYEHLAQLLAPVLGAWGHHWAAQGASTKTLLGVLDEFTGGNLDARAQAERLSNLLQNARTVYPP